MTDNEVRQLMIAMARLEEKVDGLKEDISNLNGFRDWAVRLVIGAVIVALLGLVLANGGH
jgi:hypothetical protein